MSFRDRADVLLAELALDVANDPNSSPADRAEAQRKLVGEQQLDRSLLTPEQRDHLRELLRVMLGRPAVASFTKACTRCGEFEDADLDELRDAINAAATDSSANRGSEDASSTVTTVGATR